MNLYMDIERDQVLTQIAWLTQHGCTVDYNKDDSIDELKYVLSVMQHIYARFVALST